MRLAALTALLGLVFTQISCIDLSSGTEQNNTQDDQPNEKLLSSVLDIGKANPPVEANTPPALKAGSTSQKVSHRAATYDDCRTEVKTFLGISDADWDDKADNLNNACKAGVDVKGRYFSGGPTEIRRILSDVDGAIEGYKTRTENAYLPCADTNNSTGGTLESASYNPYNLIANSTSFTFDDGETFDMGMTYHLSCGDQMTDNENNNFTRAFGIKDGTTYIYEGGDAGRGMIASIDIDDNVDVWLGFGAGPVEWSDGLIQYFGASDVSGVSYPSTTGVVHMKSTSANNTIELTGTGVGLMEGCDAHLITNDQYMFIQQNQNYYGVCYEGDDGTTADGNIRYLDANGDVGPKTFDPKLEEAVYCLDVSGDSPTLTAYKNCVDAGLATCEDTAPTEGTDDDGEVDLLTSSTTTALQGQPVSCVGNFALAGLNRQAIKIHNTTHLFTALHTDVEPFQAFPAALPPIDGTLIESSFYMTKDRTASTSSRAGAFCKDVPPLDSTPASGSSKSINEIFTLDLADLSATELAKLQSANAIRVKFFVTHNDVADRGYADFSATATVDVDGTTAGVPATFTYTANATEQVGEIALDEIASSLTSSSVIRISLSGTNQATCYAGATRMTAISVAAGLGSPRVLVYNEPEPPEQQEETAE